MFSASITVLGVPAGKLESVNLVDINVLLSDLEVSLFYDIVEILVRKTESINMEKY